MYIVHTIETIKIIILCVFRLPPSRGSVFCISAGTRVILLLLRYRIVFRDTVRGWIGSRVIPKHAKHGRDVCHIVNHVVGYLANPFSQCFLVQRPDHLVGRTFHPATSTNVIDIAYRRLIIYFK